MIKLNIKSMYAWLDVNLRVKLKLFSGVLSSHWIEHNNVRCVYVDLKRDKSWIHEMVIYSLHKTLHNSKTHHWKYSVSFALSVQAQERQKRILVLQFWWDLLTFHRIQNIRRTKENCFVIYFWFWKFSRHATFHEPRKKSKMKKFYLRTKTLLSFIFLHFLVHFCSNCWDVKLSSSFLFMWFLRLFLLLLNQKIQTNNLQNLKETNLNQYLPFLFFSVSTSTK